MTHSPNCLEWGCVIFAINYNKRATRKDGVMIIMSFSEMLKCGFKKENPMMLIINSSNQHFKD